jgi:hypothetical protein
MRTTKVNNGEYVYQSFQFDSKIRFRYKFFKDNKFNEILQIKYNSKLEVKMKISIVIKNKFMIKFVQKRIIT